MKERNHFGAMMVETGAADAMISGLTRKYADPIRPALQIIGVQEGVKRVAGMYIMNTKQGPYFFADTTQLIEDQMETFFSYDETGRPKLLEINTSTSDNHFKLEEFFQSMK